MRIACEPYGRTTGHAGQAPTQVDAYTLTNDAGLSATILTYGAHLTAVHVPNGRGTTTNIVLACASLADYERRLTNPYLGAVVGRYANRIANGSFVLDGVAYTLATNNPPNHLHGGVIGFDRYVWAAEAGTTDAGAELRLRHTSPDGDEGYPGALEVEACYRLGEDNCFTVQYRATTDRPTIVNLTNHAYWNLAGTGTIHDHELRLRAEQYLPVDASQIPTGELAPVAGTRFDFRTPHRLGERLGEGYDHCYVVHPDGPLPEPRPVATLTDPASGREMEVSTDQPGVQLYTGNKLSGSPGADGRPLVPHAGVCLETQHLPDSPNQAHFPSPVLRPGDVYRHTTIHRFRWPSR